MPMCRTIRFSLILLILLAVASLAGCLGSGHPIRYYTVQHPPTVKPPADAYPVTLVVGRISAPDILKDQPIAYRSGQNEIGTYRYHQWIEPPAQMVKNMLIDHLRDSGKYASVAELGGSTRGEFLLHGRLYDFEEVDTSRITVLVSMEFELIDLKTRKTVWTHAYSRSEPVQGKQIPEVVSALDRVLSQGLTEVVDSLNAYFSSRLAGRPEPGRPASPRSH